jgi:hypothetical protein
LSARALKKHAGPSRLNSPRLSFLGRLIARLFDDEGFDFGEFFFKSVREISGAVLKQNDKAEGKEDKQRQPEQAAEQCHGRKANLARASGQFRRTPAICRR